VTGSDLLATIRERRSIRTYTPEPIAGELIDELVEALRWAPSSGNYQCRKFFFVRNAELRQQLQDACFNHDWIAEAPLVVVCCLDRKIEEYYGEGSTHFAVQDVSASIQNLLLLAHDRGLGSCWVCAYDPARVRELLDLPPELELVAIVTVGHGAESPALTERVSREEAVAFLD
jgi:nitroreductase